MSPAPPSPPGQRPGWLDGTVALAVGGASGIGRGVVEAFLDEGALVDVLDRDEDQLDTLAAAHPEVNTTVGDATEHETVDSAVGDTVRRHGRLDTLLVFVGVFDWYRGLEEMTSDELSAAFDELFTVNVKATLLAVHASVAPLRASRGNVVLTLSTSSFYPGRGGTLYVASKFALRGLVVQLGHEFAPEVRVNGVAPGGTVSTNLSGLAALGTAQRRLGDQPGRADDVADRTPLQIAMGPDDHAGAYVYLASSRARGVTGVIVNSDGGMAVRG